jgi:hypothetical protein
MREKPQKRKKLYTLKAAGRAAGAADCQARQSAFLLLASALLPGQ